jgi:PhoPQ-activated pathogenicity-related protein
MGEDWILHGKSIDGIHSWTSYTLNVTSQKWLDDADYSPNSEGKSIWWHMMVVIVPNDIKWSNNATLWITGHGMGYRPTSNKDEDIALAASLAMGTGTVTGVLFQIPNEDITFAADPLQMSRGEDEIIAFTW